MTSSILTLARSAAADRTITRAEAQQLVDKVRADGRVTSYEQAQLREALTQYKDLFTPEAEALVKPLLERTPPPGPGQVVNLDPTPSQRPVYLGADGLFTENANGAAPSRPARPCTGRTSSWTTRATTSSRACPGTCGRRPSTS
jgi:hypothetical protein